MSVKQVLIAHQSTIPHYRVPFYHAVERLRPTWWEFTVVYDIHEARRNFFLESNYTDFNFNTEPSYTYKWHIGSKQISFQSFPLKAWKYDLVVVGSALNNISYPLSSLLRYCGKSVAYLGHGRDSSIENPVGIKAIERNIQICIIRRSNGFFAYTNTVSDYLVNKGIDRKKIFILYNTIDIEKQRLNFNKFISQRKTLREQKGLENKKILLFVGRLNKRKSLDFLINTFSILKEKYQSYHMIIVGGGDISFINRLREKCGEDSFSYYGVVSDDDIGYFYVMSDLYVFPGAVGFGPLQALCFDLTPAVIDSPVHNPEYEYLNNNNSLILPKETTEHEYAGAIDRHMNDRAEWEKLRSQAWPSIKHLTIENMANNFIDGVNCILNNA